MVLLIMGLLLAGLVPTISSLMEQKYTSETRKQLDEIQQALIGFTVTNGRLPCPASANSNGAESFASGGGDKTNGKCSNFRDGFVPAATLGISASNNLGYAMDAWGNRIRYAVTSAGSTNPFTSANGMRKQGIDDLSPDLLVCSSASSEPDKCSVANSSLTSNPGVPVVIYSTGKNGGSGGTSTDEAENPNPNSADSDRIFVSHSPTTDFDDIMVWVSPHVLINRMVRAGRLP